MVRRIATMSKRVVRYWEAEVVDLPSASVAKRICELRPGEAVTIKHIGTATKYIAIGPTHRVSTTHGYKLEHGETISFAMDKNEDKNAMIEIYGLPEAAGDDVCYVKIIGKGSETEAT